jgi:3-methyladenine DNA glycosylase AlkC
MAEPLKNLFNTQFFDALIAALTSAYPTFDRAKFLQLIYGDQWEALELKARTRHITLTLCSVLPAEYRAALAIMRQASAVFTLETFGTMLFPDFVEVYGLDDWEASIPALEQFTQQSSAEFAVRPFILRDQDRMMAQMLHWTHHVNHHVRRLASEGCRPRLPWAVALPAFKADPSPVLPVLEALKTDDSEYVRRSVANNLNDIAKDHPQVVIDTLRRWRTDDSPAMIAILNRALRTLIKAGNSAALDLVGYAHQAVFTINNLRVESDSLPIGGELIFSFSVESSSEVPQALMIDYVVHFQRANGRLTPKVFKLAKKTLAPGETLTIRKKHSFRAITTRTYYPGDHALEIQINGVRSEGCRFAITA